MSDRTKDIIVWLSTGITLGLVLASIIYRVKGIS